VKVNNQINRPLAQLPTAASQQGERGLRFSAGAWEYANDVGLSPHITITMQLKETVRSDQGLHVLGDLGSISMQLDPTAPVEMLKQYDLFDPITGVQVPGVKWTPAQLMALLYSAGIAGVDAAKQQAAAA
jgi:hypothetical protein